ncbi:hypothetical protein Tco_0656935 [Tanacetum coccineum]|uniref:Reverse transcriptase domain-containing protein n=1 Tax=Tanacetum coccineum TaxID=301880 RepID=A0ABQ4XAD1_9ASTR
MRTRSQARKRRQQQVRQTSVESPNLEKPDNPPIVTMADNRTMAQLLEAPTEGYKDAIVIPKITANNFEIKHGLLNLVQNKGCPHHGFSELHQLVTILYALTQLIKIHGSLLLGEALPPQQSHLIVAELKDMVRALILDRKNQTSASAPVKAVEQSCVTCGGGHSYQNCPATNSNNYHDNIQEYVSQAAAAVSWPCGQLQPSNSGYRDLRWSQIILTSGFPTPFRILIEIVKSISSEEITSIKTKGGGKQFQQSWRCFLKTSHALIDVYEGEITLRVGKEAITFNLDQTSKYTADYNHMTVNKIDVIDMACDEYSQEVLGFSNVIASGNPTPYSEPIVSTASPTLTPFGDSDFLLMEEADSFLALEDDPTSSEVDPTYQDPEGDILLLEAILNSEPPPPLPNHEQYMPGGRKELKLCEAKTVESSVNEPPEVELKELPPHLEYAFLEGDDKLPVIIAKDLKDEEKAALLKVLKSHKRAIAWKLSDIKGVSPEFCTHKILMEEDYEPSVQSQRRVNPKIHDVIKKEVEKLLDAGLIYPISDSPWVSPVHCVPKKGGMTVITNEENELIPTRLVTGWRVCIDYRKLNEATRKDHFPLPFMDQMLERLAGNEYYCFLDGFSGERRCGFSGQEALDISKLVTVTYWGHYGANYNTARKIFASDFLLAQPSTNDAHELFTPLREDTQYLSMGDFGTDNQEKDEKQSQNDKTGLGMEKTVKDKAKSKPESQSSQKVNRKVNPVKKSTEKSTGQSQSQPKSTPGPKSKKYKLGG